MVRRTQFIGLAAVSAVVACAVLGTGCGSSTTHTTTAQLGGRIAGNTLTIALPVPPTNLNPALTQSDPADVIYSSLAYDSLTNINGAQSFGPQLAISWRYSSHRKIFTLTLRHGVRFSDGTPLTASAAAASINYWRKTGSNAAYSALITAVRATARYTIEVQTSSSGSLLPFLFSRAGLAGNLISPAALKAPDRLTSATAGAGPYMLSPSGTVTGSTYTYVPNPHYWDKSRIHYKKIVVNVIQNPNSALQAVKTGQADFMISDPNTVAAAGGLNVYRAPATIEGAYLVDRGGAVSTPLGDVRVRQALNYAINRQAIAAALFGHWAQPTDEISLPGMDGYDPTYDDHYQYDPVKAKALLREAGYPNGFHLTILSSPVFGLDNVSQAIASDLQKVGVTLTLSEATNGAAYISDATSKHYPVIAMYYGGLPMTLETATLLEPDAEPFNPFHSTDATMLALAQQAGQASSEAAQAQTYQKLQQRVVNVAWFLPVLRSDEIMVANPKLRGLTIGPGNILPNAADWYPAN